MKSSLRVRTLEAGEPHVRLPAELLTALALRPGDQMYGVMVEGPGWPDGAESPIGPLATLYASPLPHRAWGRLVRLSFTSGPGPGTLARLTQCLQTLRLYPRFVESAETRPLNPTGQVIDPLETSGPDTTTIVEIPTLARLRHDRLTDGTLRALHDLVSSPDGRPVVQKCSTGLQRDLERAAGGAGCAPRLESVAPLQTLNHLVPLLTAEEGKRFRQVPLEPVAGDPRRALMTCAPWRSILWPDSRRFIEEVGRPHGVPLAAIVSVDTSEHLLTLQFYRLDDTIVASFDIVVPAAGLEHRWWQWIYEEVGDAHGSILGSRSSGRRQARWGSLSVVAVLPGKRSSASDGASPPKNDIAHAINCIRGLKGDSSFSAASPRFQALLKDVEEAERGGAGLRRAVTEDCLDVGKAASQLRRSARTDSLLQNLRLWYSPQAPLQPGYEPRFGQNPFSFTKPLYLGTFKQTYHRRSARSASPHPEGKLPEHLSRMRLAKRLREHLTRDPVENVVLVGAYRSGKTSVINVVVDLINEAPSVAADEKVATPRPVLAVRINAAVTPPELLFVAVFNEICKLIESKFAGPRPRALARFVKEIARRLSGGFSQFLALEPSLEVEFAAPFIEKLMLTLHGKPPRKKPDKVQEAADKEPRRMSAESTSQRAGRLRASITMLRALLREAARVYGEDKDLSIIEETLTPEERKALKKAEGPLHVVVALDEVTDSAAWGSKWAFPAWRELIEDPSSEASWLFSSTRPLASATDYSPLGNAMREYNLEPLQPSETDELISNFERSDHLSDEDDPWSVRPTITYYARRLIGTLAGHQPYVLQVLCCHLFEQSIRHQVPIVTSRLVEKIVLERVLPELADYFASQWRTLSEDHAGVIKQAVRESAEEFTLEPWLDERFHVAATHRFRPEVQKAIERAGVGSSRHPTVLVPLFAKWVQQHFALPGRTPERGAENALEG